jgi:hypothetical protein
MRTEIWPEFVTRLKNGALGDDRIRPYHGWMLEIGYDGEMCSLHFWRQLV